MIELKGKYNKDCKIYCDEVENEALSLIQRILDNPVSKDVPVRIMPDVHAGVDITIGFTMPVTDRVNPNHIGVDIGCGMSSVPIATEVLDDDLAIIDRLIQEHIPMGMQLREVVSCNTHTLFSMMNNNLYVLSKHLSVCRDYTVPVVDGKYISELCRKIGMNESVFYHSIGTLGGGNHFIEIGKDSTGIQYLTIHTGSRNFGHKVCTYHSKVAKSKRRDEAEYQKEVRQIIDNTDDKTKIPALLRGLEERYPKGKSELMGVQMLDYLVDMCIAQAYAKYNRFIIYKTIFDVCGWAPNGIPIETLHNYIDFDNWIIRKGAISAHENEIVVIPMNMRDGILLCKGKGNTDWNYSAPHGAGRLYSRSKAKELLTMEEFKESMKNVRSSCICESTLDESPMAYKSMNMIMEAVKPTVSILDRIVPVLNIKAK